jgi:glycosyltransferase involved in cell wall biosynthesis
MAAMKLIVFAHVPPPHHGQSQMVKLMVDGFRSRPDLGIEVLHVDARLSSGMSDVGSIRGGKVQALLAYCRDAIRLSMKQDCRTLYYIPSPPKRSSLYRDFLVMALIRWRFDRVILHWHAVGLGAWLESEACFWERWLAHACLGRVRRAIVLATSNRGDAEVLRPSSVAVVSNGIPDPCPDFSETLANRRSDIATRAEIQVLFMAHCTRDKGLFGAVEAVVAANATNGSRRRFRLTVAGSFLSEAEETEFRERIRRSDALDCVEIAGFVSGADKDRLLRRSDVFLFPTYFANEGQPLNLIEALAYGLPCVTTRWRSIPEYFATDYPGLCIPRDIPALARALHAVVEQVDGKMLRLEYERSFAVGPHLEALAAAIRQD